MIGSGGIMDEPGSGHIGERPIANRLSGWPALTLFADSTRHRRRNRRHDLCSSYAVL